MQKINYLCIDDASQATVAPLLEPVKASAKRLQFSYEQPTEFSVLLRTVKAQDPDGVILDIRLDENANTAGQKVDFRGLAVAQELRTRMTEGIISNIPIVLWSVVRKFARSYKNDLTSHDLFDAVYDKEVDITGDPKRVAKELVALCDGYVEIGKPSSDRKTMLDLLAVSPEDQKQLDPRVGEFELDARKAPTHEIVEYLLHSVIDPPGPLIDEAHVAARLGIDIARSRDWDKLLERIQSECKYSGVFSEGWPRWWAHQLNTWWESLKERPGRLQKLQAKQRVDFLKHRFRWKNLRPARPIDAACASTYWTICEVLKQPLDPVDGLRIRAANSRPYQEPRYVSIAAVLERKHIPLGIEIDPLESTRLERIKHVKKTRAE
jgi:hypothetical protein